jgi:hypothetical protein
MYVCMYVYIYIYIYIYVYVYMFIYICIHSVVLFVSMRTKVVRAHATSQRAQCEQKSILQFHGHTRFRKGHGHVTASASLRMCLSVIFLVNALWRRPHIRDSRDGIGFEKRHGLQADP